MKPDTAEIARAVAARGWHCQPADIEALLPLVAGTLDGYRLLDEHARHAVQGPRDSGFASRPPTAGENPQGAWYRIVEAPGHRDGPLAGRRVAIKESIFVAGVPLSNGSALLEGFVPAFHATVVRRLIDAGGVIAGTAACEAFCFSGSSFTSAAGPVHNPRRHGHSAGGSSSGCAALVGAGAVRLAVGGDQAGSVRIPAALCGVCGMKPTYGLVPYTGAIPVEPALDHLGPITATVAENALLLDVLAGDDGIDPRQRHGTVPSCVASLARGAEGVRVGVLREGFGHAHADPGVDASVLAALDVLRGLGASVREVSMALHGTASAMCRPLLVEGAIRTLFDGDGFGTGRRDRYPVPFMQAMRRWDGDLGALPAGMRASLLAGATAMARDGATHYARAANVGRELRGHYDALLDDVDILAMPTTPRTAPRLPDPDAGAAELAAATFGFTTNTFPFNVTGHPALSIPCGAVDGLPVGLMLVGRHFDEPTIYRLAHAFEQAGASARRPNP